MNKAVKKIAGWVGQGCLWFSCLSTLASCGKISDADIAASQQFILGLMTDLSTHVTGPIGAGTIAALCTSTTSVMSGCNLPVCDAGYTTAVIDCRNVPTANPNQRVQAIYSTCGSKSFSSVGSDLQATITVVGGSLRFSWNMIVDIWDTSSESNPKIWLAAKVTADASLAGSTWSFLPNCGQDFSGNINMLDVTDCATFVSAMPTACQ